MEKRVHHQVTVLRGQPHGLGPLHERGDVLPVGGHGSLGRAGGARGVQNVGNVGGANGLNAALKLGVGHPIAKLHKGIQREFVAGTAQAHHPPQPGAGLRGQQRRIVHAEELPHCKGQPRPGTAHDIARLLALEAGVDGHEHAANLLPG